MYSARTNGRVRTFSSFAERGFCSSYDNQAAWVYAAPSCDSESKRGHENAIQRGHQTERIQPTVDADSAETDV